MKHFKKEICINALQRIIVECRRYRKADKWSVHTTHLDDNAYTPFSALYALRCDKDHARKLIKEIIRIAKREGLMS